MSQFQGRCHRIEDTYNGCGHIAFRYVYCNGGHQNDYLHNKACNETKRPPPGTTEKAPGLPGYCSNFCKAKAEGWYCCQCVEMKNGVPTRQFVTGYLMGNPTTLVHDVRRARTGPLFLPKLPINSGCMFALSKANASRSTTILYPSADVFR